MFASEIISDIGQGLSCHCGVHILHFMLRLFRDEFCCAGVAGDVQGERWSSDMPENKELISILRSQKSLRHVIKDSKFYLFTCWFVQ